METWLIVSLVLNVALGITIALLYHWANSDAKYVAKDLTDAYDKMSVYFNRISAARQSISNSWMYSHDEYCIIYKDTTSPCDCGTDIFNAILNDTLQHLTTKP
jgi:hypothetical protein